VSDTRGATVALEDVRHVYRSGPSPVYALEAIDLEIGSGEFVCITGASGSGKSTLLHLLGLLDTPTAGRYHLDGEDVAGLDDVARAMRRNRKIGFVFQAFHLVPHLTVAENVMLPLVYGGVAPTERAARAATALEAVGLGRRSGHRPAELSGGEQQRAAVARALIGRPALLLADEPTGNLDDDSATGLLDLFRAVHDAGTTVVTVTHNARVAAAASRRYELREGRVVG
jgi:putative ABC transport system ATP-binding protein